MTFSNKNGKLATKFQGPYKIIKVNENYALLQPEKGKPIKHNILHLKPYFAPAHSALIPSGADIAEEGEGLDSESKEDPNTELVYTVNLMVSKKVSSRKSINYQQLINLINDTKEINEIRQYFFDHALKILTNQDPDVNPLTPQERTARHEFSTWERSVILTGSPLGVPELRTNLSAMPGPTPVAPPPRSPRSSRCPPFARTTVALAQITKIDPDHISQSWTCTNTCPSP